ncbi:MAG: molybdopterin-dependent oxidoreductase, partial [Mycobacteriales bacterium]
MPPTLQAAPLRTAVATHCPYCALQCSMSLTPVGAAATVEAGAGGLCAKGWTSAALLDSPRRLSFPLVRDGRHGHLREASWDEALDRAADGFRTAQHSAGADAVGVFGGGGLTNEKAYLLGKFAR